MGKQHIKAICPEGVGHRWRAKYPWSADGSIVEVVDYDPDAVDEDGNKADPEKDPEKDNIPNVTPSVINSKTYAALVADPHIIINSGEDPKSVDTLRAEVKRLNDVIASSADGAAAAENEALRKANNEGSKLVAEQNMAIDKLKAAAIDATNAVAAAIAAGATEVDSLNVTLKKTAEDGQLAHKEVERLRMLLIEAGVDPDTGGKIGEKAKNE